MRSRLSSLRWEFSEPFFYLFAHGMPLLTKERYRQASQKSSLAYWMDWSEEEMLEWMTDYYNDMVNYYQDAATNHKAMLLYLT